MATASAASNNNNKSSGLGLNRLILSRPCNTPSISVDHAESQKSSNISNGGSSSTNMKNSSSNVGGALSRTLQQIGKFFNSGLTPTEATAPAFKRAHRESLNKDALYTLNPAFATNETFSRRDSFGRSYSFTRCASFSYASNKEEPGN